jgi:hypothetical protein
MSISAHHGSDTRSGFPWPGRTAVTAASWSLAGGLAGGLLVAAFVSAGRLHPDVLVAAVVALLFGSFGAVHGAVLAHLGRPAEDRIGTSWHSRRRWSRRALAVLATILSVGVAAMASVGLVMNAALARAGSRLGAALVIAGVVVCAGVILWATVLGWRALERAYARWPDHRLGTWLGVGVFAVLAATFVLLQPALPGMGFSVSPAGGLLLAALATVWVALPAIVIALSLSHRSTTGTGPAR